MALFVQYLAIYNNENTQYNGSISYMMQNTDEEIINNGRENLTKDQIIDYTYADIQTDEFD